VKALDAKKSSSRRAYSIQLWGSLCRQRHRQRL